MANRAIPSTPALDPFFCNQAKADSTRASVLSGLRLAEELGMTLDWSQVSFGFVKASSDVPLEMELYDDQCVGSKTRRHTPSGATPKIRQLFHPALTPQCGILPHG